MRSLLVVVLLAGCAGLPDQSVRPVEITCNAANWQELVGQPEEALYGALGNLRVLKPGQVITKDLNRDRLNAVIGKDGLIKRFGCY